jgi:hypothetical protein
MLEAILEILGVASFFFTTLRTKSAAFFRPHGNLNPRAELPIPHARRP